ncbi:MAG: ATP-binding protein [Alloprevotella sp.]|nr:ATP-binding protein [Alloprevotella sp.]
MAIYANFISRIEISSLWSGRKHIVWNPDPTVNVLSGKNGAGKSTILNRIIRHLREAPISGEVPSLTRRGVTIQFDNPEADCIRYDIIRSFDRTLQRSDAIDKLVDIHANTELDWQLYVIQRRYLDYQVNVGNRMISLLTSGAPDAQEQATAAADTKNRFLDIVDELFSETGKRIDRQSNELRFLQYDEVISPYVLSSGEKQILLILLTALTEDQLPYVLFMDEPEASLHFDWQQRLIDLVRELNPNAQIILTTHSPSIVMNGWQEVITNVEDITIDE